MKTVVLYDRLDEVQREMHERIDRVLSDGAVQTQSDAQERAPVDTGRLRASIQVVRIGNHLWEVFTVVEYAGYQEYGTVHMSAHPFMRPAYERNYREITASLHEAFATI